MNSEEGGGDLPAIRFPIERSHALMRAVWRLLSVVIVGGALFVVRPDWRLLWLTEKASFLALAVIMLCGAAAAIGLSLVAIRWLLLACWPSPLGIEITPERVSMWLGPFGTREHAWSGLRLELGEDIDWDMMDLMPDDAFVPRLRVVASGADLIDVILKFARVSHEELTRALRPYLVRRHR